MNFFNHAYVRSRQRLGELESERVRECDSERVRERESERTREREKEDDKVNFTQVSLHTQINLMTCSVCFVKHMMITTQVRQHTHPPRSPSLRRISIQEPAARISQLSRRENGSISPNTNL